MLKKIAALLSCLLCAISPWVYTAEQPQFSTSPPETLSHKWRIGYLEGGPYASYQEHLIEIPKALAELGWIEPLTFPLLEDTSDTERLWTWLANHVHSDYLEFAEDAYSSNNWDDARRKDTKTRLLTRLNEEQDLDLMIAMGTWAGQDLANNDHNVPTIVCSTADALQAGIIKSIDDSGYNHVHARIDPTRYERQIRAFHDVIGFKRLGVAFEDTAAGRSYAATDALETVAHERNFSLVACHVREHDVALEDAEADMIRCARELAPQIDAFYLPSSLGNTADNLPHILAILNRYRIPTFSQRSAQEVRQGVLLSVAKTSARDFAVFHAETMAKIINGATPRDLNQVYEAPVNIAFNKATAKMIDLDDDTYHLLLDVADDVYEDIARP